MKFITKDYQHSPTDFLLFMDIITLHFPNVNKNNTFFIKTLYNEIRDKKIKGQVHFMKIYRDYFRLIRENKPMSDSSILYWTSLGWSEAEAIKKISIIQTKKSHLNKSYWVSKGFTDEEAIKKIKNIQSKNSKKRYEKYSKKEIIDQSVWSKSHWLNKGLTEEQANYEVSKRNYSKREFWNSDKEYEEIRKLIGKKTSNFIKENPERFFGYVGSVSKEETNFFKCIIENCDRNILHIGFVVNVQASVDLNQAAVKYDGYLKCENGVILIEYDGLYWHNQSYDEIKDDIVLTLRKDILGIIRISDLFYKKNYEKTLKLINDGINKIKSKECNRIKIY